jgi:hypothetical protein
MALNFPSPATNGQIYTENGITYTYDSTYSVWKVSPIPVPDVFGVANGAFGRANAGYTVANAGYTTANAAFVKANNALANTTNVVFSGNVSFTGSVNAASILVNGSILTGSKTVSVISANTNAVKNYQYVATASLVLTLPSSPTAGDEIGFTNMSSTTTCNIAPGSEKIMSVSGNLQVDITNTALTLVYADATRGWVFA